MGNIASSLIARIERATSVAELHAVATSFSQDEGFPHFLYAVCIPKPPGNPIHYVIPGYPAEWRKLYYEREYVRIDPIVQHAFTSAMPVAWDEVPRRNEAVMTFFAEAAAHGLVHGVSAPVYSRRGEMGLFSLARQVPLPLDPDVRLKLKQDLQMFATCFNEVALRLPIEQKPALDAAQRLTRRERECLAGVAEGKKNGEIAQDMGITERTVLAHLETAGQKLGVSGRHKVAMKAVAMGELELNRLAIATGRALPKAQEYRARQ